MLGTYLVTHQTNQKGIEIKYVLIEEAVSIKKELYLAITIDRSLQTPILIASAEGGVEIEEVAKNHLIQLSRNRLIYFLDFTHFRYDALHQNWTYQEYHQQESTTLSRIFLVPL